MTNYDYMMMLSEESLADKLAKIHLDGFKENSDDEIPDDLMYDEVNRWKRFLYEERDFDGI